MAAFFRVLGRIVFLAKVLEWKVWKFPDNGQ